MIKLGALGDFVQACGPFKAIRAHHVEDQITLLTTKPFVSMAKTSDYFDTIWVDDRPALLRWGAWLRLRKRLTAGNFSRVYDLQTSGRTALYFKLFRRASIPEWSGIAAGCSHPHRNPKRDFMHTLDRQSEQLREAGINCVLKPELSWLRSDIKKFGLSQRYALLVPGGSARRVKKQWAVNRFRELAIKLNLSGLQVVLIGQGSEAVMHSELASKLDGVVSLAGETTLAEVAELGRFAKICIGNDTGPKHILAAANNPVIVLFGPASDPTLCAPQGENVVCLMPENGGPIENLSLERVWSCVTRLIGST